MLTLLTTACSNDGDGDRGAGTTSSADSATETTASTTTTTTSVVPTAQLRIAEQGFSTFPDPLDEEATLGGYGVIVENPNTDALATGVTVRSRILAADGAVLFDDTALLNGIMPGQRMAVGGTLLEPIAAPNRLDVQLQVAAWLTPADETGEAAAEDIVTAPEADGGARTRFSVRSTWPVDEEGVDVTAIYRAADGRILAGEQTTIELLPAGGSVASEVRLLAPIPDLARTDVLVGRGFGAQTVG